QATVTRHGVRTFARALEGDERLRNTGAGKNARLRDQPAEELRSRDRSAVIRHLDAAPHGGAREPRLAAAERADPSRAASRTRRDGVTVAVSYGERIQRRR